MTKEERRARAYAAQALLDDPTLKEGWAQLENDMREQWERCWLPRKRDRIWTQLKHLKALRSRLASFAGEARE